jgi:hypothetical protein
MTRAKKLKKAIRARAGKTGESYTSARRQVLQARTRRSAAATPVTAPAPAPQTPAAPPSRSKAAAAAKSRRTTGERAVLEKTGHGLDHWFAVLDAFGAAGGKGHTARAAHLHQTHGVPGWHCQMITVEYERARGLRVPNQSGTGEFQVSVSKTVAATVAEVARTLSDPRTRGRWLKGVDAHLARAVKAAFTGPQARTVHFKKPDLALVRFPWDGRAIEVYISGKPGRKASVVVNNRKLAGTAEVEQRRAAWSQALEALKAQLAR